MLGLLISACGLPFIVLCINASVVLHAERITVAGMFRQTKFKVAYDRIDSIVEILRGNRERFFVVKGDGHSVRINDMYADFDAMWQELSKRIHLQSN